MTARTRQSLHLLSLCLVLLSTGCSSLISVTRDKPIGENYGTRTTGAYVDDQLIETKSKVNLVKTDERFKNAKVSVDSYNGVVLLTGHVLAGDMRDIATTTVQKIRKVRRVHNELEINPPRSWAASIGDAWLSTKVKSRLLFTKNIPSQRVEVITENGVVFLMGLVSHNEAEMIVASVRQTYGLQKIVRVFEYID